MSDKEFREAYHTNGERCGIILIEDIDAIFNGRENVLAKTNRTKSLLSFDTLINTIQGVTQNNGIFLIITTNHREKLDPSLIRPGRIDVQIEVKSLDVEGRQFIAANILRDWKDLQDKLVNECEGCTAAEVENKAVEMALTKFYEKRS
jgi:ATP-dependent 26S proteasome regulatory subunit